jgi:DNA replication protein DnaC
MERLTADDLNTALDMKEKQIKKFSKQHPNEKIPLCPKCKNVGLYRRCFDENGKELFGDDMNKAGSYDYFYPCDCVDIKNNQTLKNHRKFASVPQLYADADFSNFQIKIYQNVTSLERASVALRDSKAFVGNFDKFEEKGLGLFIWSDARGSGKTRLASIIANELIRKEVRVRYESANKILSEIQKAWSDSGVSENEILKNYIEPRVLIIDDFGARSGKDWMDEKFLMIIDARYQGNKVTIFTSNYEIERLPFHDMRIIDRLSDVNRFHNIRMPDESVRQRSRIRNGGNELFYELAKSEG